MSPTPDEAAPQLSVAELVTLGVLLVGGIVLCALLVGRLMEHRSPLGGILAAEPIPTGHDGAADDE